MVLQRSLRIVPVLSLRSTRRLQTATILLWAVCCAAAQDPLPSWNAGPTKKAILEFVDRVTRDGSRDFVRPAERIAVFDNDGTLWCEQPMYVQAVFALDRVRELANDHPEWKEEEPFRSLLLGDPRALELMGETGLLEILSAGYAGMTTDDFNTVVKAWLRTAQHPRFHRPYDQLVYQPMIELLAYLRSKGFKTFIASGGGTDFMRAFAEEAYGIPPEQVIGSLAKLKFEMREGKPVLIKEPGIEFVNDGPGKPVGIHRFIGRRPVMAFGNSDGDLQMLLWTTASGRPGFGLLVHHSDGVREYAYDRTSRVGRLDKALDEAGKRGWTVLDMKKDWKIVFPEARAGSTIRAVVKR
jgi:phosphoglycolate phosphatase-like HAD superfamily hydrolase